MEIITMSAGFLGTNTYIILNGGNAVILDPDGDGGDILKLIEKRGAQSTAVLLTHGHFDHVGAAAFFQELGVKIYGHPADKDMEVNKGFRIKKYSLDYELTVGGELDIAGLKIKVIFTPGHSRGCVCYIVGDSIFTGDTLFYHDHGRTDLPGGNPEQMNESLERLFKLAGDYTLYPGHGQKSLLSEERRFFGYV